MAHLEEKTGDKAWDKIKLKILNSLSPGWNIKEYSSISYGSAPRQSVDIYVPNQSREPAAVVVFFYGGSWHSGYKEGYKFVGRRLASQGYVVVVADYRLYPDVCFPEFVHDGALCLKWVYNNIAGYKGNPHKIFVMGHSAGALIASMLSINPEYLNNVGVFFKIINGMIGLAGTYDFLPLVDPIVKKVFAKVDLQATQPINFVTEGLPAFLLITGDDDTRVLPKNSINLAVKLKTNANSVVLKLYENLNHRDVLLTLSPIFSNKAPILKDIDKFIAQHSQ